MGDEDVSTAVMLATINGKMDLLNERMKVFSEISGDHENRIRSLEKAVWRFAGAATILGGAVGVGFQFIGG